MEILNGSSHKCDETFASSQEHINILADLEHVQIFLLVDSSEVNSILFNDIQHMKSNYTIIHGVEKIRGRIRINW